MTTKQPTITGIPFTTLIEMAANAGHEQTRILVSRYLNGVRRQPLKDIGETVLFHEVMLQSTNFDIA
jgi:hypothetical protein